MKRTILVVLFVVAGASPIAAAMPQAMAVSANPYATRAALAMLQKGGSAADAAIAAQLVLGLVEPQSSGIGGGAFALFWDQRNKRIQSFDGRETAPAAASEDLFLDQNGEPLQFFDALSGGRAVGVPGVIAMLELLHTQHGRLSWKELFAPAIALAEDGFLVPRQLSISLAKKVNPKLGQHNTARRYFFPRGEPLREGERVVNLAYADTLHRIAQGGAAAFYTGDIAQDIVNTVRRVDNPGLLTIDDMRGYQAKQRPPVCATYKTRLVCGMGPPTSGGITLLQMLGILQHHQADATDPLAVKNLHLFTQAARLAYADRARYLGDSDFVPVPLTALLDPAYLRARSKQIDYTADINKKAAAGVIVTRAEGTSYAQPSTSHLSIVDRFGNALSMTTSIEMAFGSGVMVRGFLLNNQLTDFAFTARQDGRLLANSVAGGKRPRSSMAPTIVLEDNQPRLIIGSPGGSRIINYVAYSVWAWLEYALDVDTLVSLPHITNRNGAATDIEKNTPLVTKAAALEALGHTINIRPLYSGLHAIALDRQGRLTGAADPRRDGIALGGQ